MKKKTPQRKNSFHCDVESDLRLISCTVSFILSFPCIYNHTRLKSFAAVSATFKSQDINIEWLCLLPTRIIKTRSQEQKILYQPFIPCLIIRNKENAQLTTMKILLGGWGGWFPYKYYLYFSSLPSSKKPFPRSLHSQRSESDCWANSLRSCLIFWLRRAYCSSGTWLQQALPKNVT